MIEQFDLVILGAGPAGLSAAIYAVRYGLKTIIISKDIGGMANLAHKIENYPGFEGSGMELMKKFYEQAKSQGAEFLNDDIIEIKKNKNKFMITTKTRKFINVKAVVIALGTQRRKLNVPGEDKFLGKGVSYCATCDAPLFKGKDVVVIGGSDSACKAALLLSGIARKVYIVHRGREERCEEITSRKLKENGNVEFLYNTIPLQIKGKSVVSEIIIDMGGKNLPREKKINAQGVFIEIGGLPVSDIARMLKIKIDKEGYIFVNEHMQTNVKGVFAAGDVVKSKLKQIVVAASQGAMAAKSANDFISRK